MKLFKKSLCLSLLILSTSALADVAVIVNSANASAINDNDISRIFLGKKKKFASGESIEPINSSAGGSARTEFEKKVLKKSANQVKAYWSKLVFSGKGKPLKEIGSDADVLKHVAENPNAIGYVDAGSVNGSVKVIKTF